MPDGCCITLVRCACPFAAVIMPAAYVRILMRSTANKLQHPMDLSTIDKRIRSVYYKDMVTFKVRVWRPDLTNVAFVLKNVTDITRSKIPGRLQADLTLMCDNCMRYNCDGSLYHDLAIKIKEDIIRDIKHETEQG